MYFPYLRGRQYELLAIRELLENNLLSSKVLPIIEPVKASSTLILSINAFSVADRDIGIVLNPAVGSLEKDIIKEKNISIKEKWGYALSLKNVVKCFHIGSDIPHSLNEIQNNRTNMQKIGLICTTTDGIRLFEKISPSVNPLFTLIPDESMFRRRIRTNRVMFADRFEKQTRNTDYADRIDEDFSADHLFYKPDGYIGFSDYSVIGSDYSETGFAPYAVAIHIVYFDRDDNLRIHHFVSDTNEDITDPAGKFEEAVRKLVEWNETQKLNTLGIKRLTEAYKNKKYPGLGTVKKYSIMHHLELIGAYLDNEVNTQ